MNPWENVEAFGAATGALVSRAHASGSFPFLVVGHQTTCQKPNDTVEFDFLNIAQDDKLSVVVLSEESWSPVWTKNGKRQQFTGYTSLDKSSEFDKWHHVLLVINGNASKTWIRDRDLSSFNWCCES
jgi:hypothetical protein